MSLINNIYCIMSSDSEAFNLIDGEEVSDTIFDNENTVDTLDTQDKTIEDSEASDPEWNPYTDGTADKYKDEIDQEIDNNLEEEEQEEKPKTKPKQTAKKQQSKAKPKQTQAKKKVIKKTVETLDLEEEKEKVEVPSLSDFSKSSCIKAIKWLLEFAHKDTVKPKHNIRDNKNIEVDNITNKHFDNKKFMTDLYNKFVESYKIKQSFRNNIDKGIISKNKEGCLCLKNGKNIIMTTSKEDNKAINEFDKMIKDIHYNINFSKIKDTKESSEIDLSLLLDFIKLDINKSSNAFNLASKYKNIIDFEGFGYIYDDIAYKEDEPTDYEVTSHYHELFTSLIYTHPSQVFIRRNGIIKNNNLFDNQFIKSVIAKTLNNIKKSNNDTDLLRAIADILKIKQFNQILFNCYNPNIILNKVLLRLFETKNFKELLDNELKEISFLFSPYMFYSAEFEKLINSKQNSRQPIIASTLINRRKSMGLVMSGIDKFIVKSNNYWTGVLNDEEQSIENYWFRTETDEEKETKKQTKQTTKKQQSKQASAKHSEAEEEKLESSASVKSISSRKSTSSRGKPRKQLDSDEEDI